jgi:hypothetical protein
MAMLPSWARMPRLPSPGPSVSLVRFDAASRSLVCRESGGSLGCRDGREACFHASYARPLSTVHQTSPPGFILRFSSPLQSSFALTSARSFRIEPDCQGLRSLLTTSPERVHVRGASQASASFRPQAITASRRFAPHSGSEVCFTLEPCPGIFSRSGDFSLRAARRLHQASLPPCRCRPSARPDLTIRRPPSERPGFEALLHAEQRSHRLGVEPDRRPLPSSRSVSSRFPALRMGPRLPRCPPLTAFRPTLSTRMNIAAHSREDRVPTPSACRLRRAGLCCHQPSRPAREFQA